MKKKGNTLVELIAAAAILLIGLGAGSVAISTYSRFWGVETKKLDAATFNQSISQNIKGLGKEFINNAFTVKNVESNGSLNFYVYYDSEEDIINTFSGDNDEVLGKFVFTASPSYDDCKRSSYGKKYGAMINMKDVREIGIGDTDTSSNFPLYEVTVTVWNLNDNNFKSASSFYIGGGVHD